MLPVARRVRHSWAANAKPESVYHILNWLQAGDVRRKSKAAVAWPAGLAPGHPILDSETHLIAAIFFLIGFYDEKHEQGKDKK